ncbi:TatD family hydrolase [Fredinandcohnia sp. 179-A 10B2 NHS]|uniref:TatD family hydrolase n=1 Tax=Fredinandcohnia sp. 179-A 10B2 NHS TaxID=3235176 RepID=UPI0039A27994
MIDAHIHLEQYDFRTLPSLIEEWREKGIKGVIAVSNDLASSYRTLELKAKFPDFVHAAVGFHPEYPLPSEADFLEWERVVRDEKRIITAIGEIGLPHYNLEKLPSLEQYNQFLSRCLDIAGQYQLPVVLHAVHDKAEKVFQMLQQKKIDKAHFHWLKAPSEVVTKIVEAGYFLSVTPEVCYRKRDQALVTQVPLTQLLLETDGPWQFDDMFKNIATTPILLSYVLDKVSELYSLHNQTLKEQILLNVSSCYEISL